MVLHSVTVGLCCTVMDCAVWPHIVWCVVPECCLVIHSVRLGCIVLNCVTRCFEKCCKVESPATAMLGHCPRVRRPS